MTCFIIAALSADGYIAKQISAVCKGRQKTHKEKLWRYKDNDLNDKEYKSKFKLPGINKRNDTGKYVVRITYNKNVYRIGEFETEEEAIVAHNIFLEQNKHIIKPLLKKE